MAGLSFSRKSPLTRCFRPRCEPLEDRCLLSAGDLVQSFFNPTPQSNPEFARAVATSGDRILVGDSHAPVAGETFVGAAHLFDATTGSLLRTFLDPTAERLSDFGTAVAMEGNYVLVGATSANVGANSSAGAVYLFDATTGVHLHTFTAPSPQDFEDFGAAVAISGNLVVVGAPGRDSGSFSGSGAAYVFDARTGTFIDSYFNPTPATFDDFGTAVAASGINFFVGAPWDDTAGGNAGAVYVYRADTSSVVRTLTPASNANGDFGKSIAVAGTSLLVGAPGENFDRGAAVLLNWTDGTVLRTFANPTPAEDDEFGRSVAFVGSNALISAPFDDVGATNAGVAHVFDTVTGGLLQTISNPSPAADDNFGVVVAALGKDIIVATPNDSTVGASQGAVYRFEFPTYAFAAATGNGADDLSLRRNGSNLELFNNVNSTVIRSVPLNSNASLLFAGANGEGDTFRFDFTNWVFALNGGMEIRGGTGSTNQFHASGADLDYKLTNVSFDYTGGGPVSVSGFQVALLTGGAGDNMLDTSGFTGMAFLEGGAGDDSLLAGSNNDSLIGGDGDDYLRCGSGDDEAEGGNGDDTVLGGSGADELEGGDDSDVINGGGGVDELTEGGDVDFVLTKTSLTGVGDDILSSIELVRLAGGDGANRIDATGFNGRTQLNGGLGNDTITGGSGSDSINAGAGADSIKGNAGSDRIDPGQDGSADIVYGGAGADVFFSELFLVNGKQKNRDKPKDFSATEDTMLDS